jgi:hypothetical protein
MAESGHVPFDAREMAPEMIEAAIEDLVPFRFRGATSG